MPRWPDKTGTTKPPRPVHLSELCSICGLYPVHPDYTAWSCEHGTWNLADDFDSGQQPEITATNEELRSALLASLDEDTLRELLAARTAPPAEDEVEKDTKTAAKK